MSHETDQKTLAEQFYATMLRARRFEEEAFEFYKKGMMPGMAHLYLGEEAVAVGVCTALKPEDCIGSTHRGHGHLVARGADMGRMMAEILGKKTGYSKGKGGTMHIMARDRGILGANGIVGAELPISTGAAYAFKLRKEPRVSVVFFQSGHFPRKYQHGGGMGSSYRLCHRKQQVCDLNRIHEGDQGTSALQPCPGIRHPGRNGRRQ